MQALPVVRQVVFNAAHVPFAQELPQHSASDEHALPSETHAALAHFPPVQLKVQHSVGDAQLVPAGEQAAWLDAHVLVVASQSWEQQSAPVTQTSP